jgi:uncharacterized protein (TIGR03437 family)
MQDRRRHKLRGAVACLFVALGASANAQTFEDFFNDNVLQEIRIVISPASWRDLQAHYLENNKYQAEFHWNFNGTDVVVSKVAIHSRGHGSRTPVKPNLRIGFDYFVAKQQFLGLSGCILKANNEDASQLKERVIFNLFRRMGLPASREAHARLFINNDYQGLYLLTEDIDDAYLKRYLGQSTGYDYNFVPSGDPAGYHFEYLGPDLNSYSPAPFEPQNHDSDPDPKPLEAFLRMINQTSDADFAATIGAYTDPKLFLAHIALENYGADADSILGDIFGANNFHFYRFAGTNFSQFLVWDKDLAFDSAQRDLFQNTNQNVLSRRILAMPGQRAQYLEMIAKTLVLAGGPGGWLEQEHAREYNQIHQAALDDANKQYQVSGVEVPASNEVFEAQVVSNANFIRDRYAFVLPALTAAGFQPASGAPTIGNGGAVNAATNSGPLAPGTLASIYGSNLAPTTAQASTLPLPTTLGGTSVYINGFAAPLLYVSSTQINVQVPWEMGLGNGSAPFTVIVSGPASPGSAPGSPFNGTLGNTISASIGAYSPGIFIALQADGSLTSAKPAGPGDILVVYANGLGPLDNPVASGQPAPLDKLSRTTQLPKVTIGSVSSEVLFSGLTPGFVGLYQINLRVPPGVTPGTATPLVVSIGGQSATATIATR